MRHVSYFFTVDTASHTEGGLASQGGGNVMDEKQSIPGLTRTEADALAALGALFIAMLVLLCTIVLVLHFLSGLPQIMVWGILFALVVFTSVCLTAFLRADVPAKHAGPPQLEFRKPVKSARTSQARAKRPVQRLKPLL